MKARFAPAVTVALGTLIVFVIPALAERRRAVTPGVPAPVMSFDCKPADLPPAEAEECRSRRHAEGQRLFEKETFGGNGRTCETCHSKATGTFSVAETQARFAANPADPLFLHDGLDDGASGTANILDHATIRVTLPLPRHLTLRDDPLARQITVRRGTPTTRNTPALDRRLMSDLREVALEAQAAGAIRGHAQSTVEPTALQLELIAEFQKNDWRFFSSEPLREFARSGVPPQLPLGTTPSEERGRVFFVDHAPVGNSMSGACAFCHSGPMLNETNQFARKALQAQPGMRIQTAGVSERNRLKNPTYTFEIRDGSLVWVVTTPDIGVLMSDPTSPAVAEEFAAMGSGVPLIQFLNMFKIPTLWGVKHTAPYFHDNSAKDFDELLEHYNFFFTSLGLGTNPLSEQDIADIKAFLNLL